MDFDKPLPLWYWILMIGMLIALAGAIKEGLDPGVQMSRTSRFIRVGLGGLWAAIIVLGMALQVWKAWHR